MPNIWAHLLFGQEVLNRVGEERIRPEPIMKDDRLRNVFNLGCQGPDFLFYHNFLPWKKGDVMTRLGSAMHNRECGPMLIEMVRYVSGRPIYRTSVVYVLGFLMHHVLDRNVHPYVFYRSGFRKWDHQRFEVAMDTLIVRARLNKETYRTPVSRQFDVGMALPEDTADMFVEATQRLYPELAGKVQAGDWHQAYRDMISAQKLFHDPAGLKRVVTFGMIEPLVYKRKVPPYDYLNESKTEWRHPAERERTSTESVWEMWEAALEDGAAVLAAALDAIASGETSLDGEHMNRLRQVVGNLSYETGFPCDSGKEIRFAEPYHDNGIGSTGSHGE